MAIPTDKDGVAWLYLADQETEINDQNRWSACGDFGVINPVLKYDDALRLNVGYAACVRHADYSWLAIAEFSTRRVLENGVVTANTCGKAEASLEPGTIVLFVRPLTLWEKLKE
jgi:hypothetical protein